MNLRNVALSVRRPFILWRVEGEKGSCPGGMSSAGENGEEGGK